MLRRVKGSLEKAANREHQVGKYSGTMMAVAMAADRAVQFFLSGSHM